MKRPTINLPLGHYIDLQTRDQTVVRSFVVQPETAPRGAMVVLQHMDTRQPGWQGGTGRPKISADTQPGVNPHVRQMAEAFAGEGYLAIAPSTFSRGISGQDYGYRFEPSRWGVRLAKPLQPLACPLVMLDVEAALMHARRLAPGCRVAVVGYCWGGLLAWRAACEFSFIDAAVCHYGGGMDSPDDRARQPRCPVLTHFGSDGRWMSRAGVDAFVAAHAADTLPGSSTLAFQHQVHDAGYGFMQPAHAGFDDAAARVAHRQTQDFLARHLTVDNASR